MSALLAPSLSLLQERNYLDPAESCRFCGCTADSACAIAFHEDENGVFSLARTDEEITLLVPCFWYVPRVCTAPMCVGKLLVELHKRGPVLLDAAGRRVNG